MDFVSFKTVFGPSAVDALGDAGRQPRTGFRVEGGFVAEGFPGCVAFLGCLRGLFRVVGFRVWGFTVWVLGF